MAIIESHERRDPISLLYVDDEEDLLTLGKFFLEREGEFRVHILTSAEDALENGNIECYDAIVSDYQMPGIDGIKFLKLVRKKFPDIPFILFTGRGREEVVIEAINNGADFYLQKGGDPKPLFVELSHKIRQAVRRKQAEYSLMLSEKQYFDFIHSLLDATYAINRSGQVVGWNRAIEKLTQVPSIDIVGKCNYEHSIPFYGIRRPLLIDLIDEPDEKISQYYSDFFRAGSSLFANATISLPDKPEIIVQIITYHLYNIAGEVIGAVESLRDITELVRTRDQLTQSEIKFKNLVEYSKDAILIISFSGIIQFINPKGLQMIEESDFDLIIGEKNILDYIHPKCHEGIRKELKQVYLGIEAYTVQYKLITAKKREIWIECIGTKIPYLDSHAVLVSARNITDRINYETALKERENHLRVIAESSPDIIVRVNRDFKILYCNPRISDYLDISPEKILGTDARNFSAYDQYTEDWIQHVTQVFENGIPVRKEWKMPSGIWLDYLIYPDFSHDNVVAAVTTSIRDVTKTKFHEEEKELYYKNLLVQRELTDALLHAVPIPVYWKSLKQKYLGCNQTLTEFLHIPPEEFVGKTIDEIWTRKKDVDKIIEFDHDLMRSGIFHPTHTKVIDKLGNEHDVIITKNFFYDHEGNIGGIVGAILDISDTLKLTNELRNREELFRMIITQSLDIFVIINSRLEITFISPRIEKLSGYLAEEIIGPVQRFIHSDDYERISDQLYRLISNPSSTETAEFRSLKRDGSYMLLEGIAVNCVDNPAINGILVTARDITDHRKTEIKLDTSLTQKEILERTVQERTREVTDLLKLKNSLITAIAHELRTPLTPLKVLLPYLLKEDNHDSRTEIIGVMEKNTEKIASIVEQILQLANLGTMYEIDEISDVNILAVVENILNIYAITAEKENIAFITNISDKLILRTSLPHLVSIIDNIISNAVKFSYPDGNVWITGNENDDMTILSIRDNGAGICKEHINMIFEPFYKEDTSRHDRSSPGLGLSVTRRLIQLIGGSITITSEGQGMGTEVILSFQKSLFLDMNNN
ncbi:MAG: PAS domain S-box protein [Methanomicrobiales archaeon]|nr:PAS domain S-box protein [Methanomicrobiales archaeon]